MHFIGGLCHFMEIDPIVMALSRNTVILAVPGDTGL
jgi:hypothetical protein